MITRRHIRIKVLHHLYAHAVDSEISAATLLKNLEKSIEEVHTLFAWDINALLRIKKLAKQQYDLVEKRNVKDLVLLERIAKLTDIPFFALCEENAALTTLMESAHIQWSEYDQHFMNIVNTILTGDLFEQYLSKEPTLLHQKRFIKEIYQEHIAENEFIHDIYEDQHAQWSDDLDAAQMMTGKVISNWNEGVLSLTIPNLFKDENDAGFGPFLMRKYFEFAEDSVMRVKEKSKNWETDRIAKIDVVLMKLCIAEWRGIDEVPVKVSLNEYLDLSKEYSTPKSSSFINGILDKIVTNLREEGLLQKVGRGIIE